MANDNNNTDEIPRVLVRRVSEEAVFPSDFVVRSAKTMTVPNWTDALFQNRTQVPTDLILTVPSVVCFLISPIPELSQKGISVVKKGVGPSEEALLMVEMHNLTSSDIEIKAGDQIAKLENMMDTTAELVDVSTQHNRTLGTIFNPRM